MRCAFALVLLIGLSYCLGCGKSETQDRGDKESPAYLTDPDPRAYGRHYEGSPLEVDETKENGKK